ncbi:isoprenylcysteine carboxylmethyltransferase family protein [Salinisphaera sp. USBA-960]|uniref:methyltransferase family protein n=1 Tax=Salinisphaera orenii TaxID=856731 RepID=UPI0013A66388|nr:isoprenylcysteine carboxylmethyltransferase family protein [Salifodinibacter halophilus]
MAALALVIAAQPAPIPFTIGCIVIAAGLLLRIWAFGHLAKNRELVTSGPYAHTRNPGYVGSALVGSGLFLAGGNATTATGIGIWIAGLLAVAWFTLCYLPRKYRVEYTRLEADFGNDAREHAANVPDFWPRLRPWPNRRRNRFSWARISDNTEWAWAPLCCLALGLMWLG